MGPKVGQSVNLVPKMGQYDNLVQCGTVGQIASKCWTVRQGPKFGQMVKFR